MGALRADLFGRGAGSHERAILSYFRCILASMSATREPRIFTFEEARSLLPHVREITRDAIEQLAAIQLALDEEESGERELSQEELQRAAADLLDRWASKIRELGVEVKGPWLVDFDSGGGYYCWKWPEEGLEYFHSYEDGFAGRLRIQ